MIVINKTKNAAVSKDARYAKTFLEKAIGLMFRKNPTTLILNTRYGIHTFGMRFSLDVLVLDNHHTVVKVIENLKPNRVAHWDPTHNIIIELPEGTIESSKTTVGDQLAIVELT